MACLFFVVGFQPATIDNLLFIKCLIKKATHLFYFERQK